MKNDSPLLRYLSFGLYAAVAGFGLVILALRLGKEQLDRAAEHRLAMDRQSFRLVQTVGNRGEIFDRKGEPLALNRRSLCIDVHPETFKPTKRGETLYGNLQAALETMAEVIGRPPTVSSNIVQRHLRYALARPLTVWRDITEEELARFCEYARMNPGFSDATEAERIYPQGSLAAHLIGRVGRDGATSVTGSRKVNYAEKDLCGREGLELFYDEYLRSMPGEERVVVDARGYATVREILVEPSNGCDLKLTLDVRLQRAVEAQLAGHRGACVIIDPRNGGILASASAPTYNPNECVPFLPREVYKRLTDDPEKPLLNRAINGVYAPGSTFKPVTALAGLASGWKADKVLECSGTFELGTMRIRCSRTWGHGDLDLAHALRESCNPYFCSIGMSVGTNALFRMAGNFGLGSKTGIDFPVEAPGAVPDALWKMSRYGEPWFPGDLAQMSIGQGMLLVTPLQMARVAAALGSGRLVTPRLNSAIPPEVRPLPVSEAHLAIVREGMRLVVDGGTGRKAGLGVEAKVIGKTGTAEVGKGSSRRKNTWFIAYVTPLETSREQIPLALAMVIENGESGGGTTAPMVAEVLKAFYNQPGSEGEGAEG